LRASAELVKRWAWNAIWVVGVGVGWVLVYVPSTTSLRPEPAGTWTGGPLPYWWPFQLFWFPTFVSTQTALVAFCGALIVTLVATRWMGAPAAIWVGIVLAQLAITYWVHVIAATMWLAPMSINIGDYIAGMWASILVEAARESLVPLLGASVGAVVGSYLGVRMGRARSARLTTASSGRAEAGK
jgi:hypothetical protein